MKKNIYYLLFVLIPWLAEAQKNPFPHNIDYPYGLTASTPNDTKIQALYNSWKNKFYEESGTMARIKYDNTKYCVSEGIGYGMLIFVYMDNANNGTQDEFDKLYNFYSRWSIETIGSRKYLMNWKITEFSGIAPADDGQNAGNNSATDAELDVAMALLMAHKQWGSAGTINYKLEAENLMSLIYDKEVDASYLLKPGNVWNDAKNPCYFELAAIKLFAQAQTDLSFTNTRNWDKVYDASVTFLKAAQNTTTGLYPDWCGSTGGKLSNFGYDFSYDACRTPWRVAWDYAWYGNTESQTMSSRTISWMNTKLSMNPKNVYNGYDITTGNVKSSDQNSCFIGGLGTALMTSSTRQSDLDTWYNDMLNRSETWGYYAPTLQILYALTMSGNTPNFFESNTPTAPEFVKAETNAEGTSILLTLSETMKTPDASNTSNFSVKINGTTSTNAISSITLSSPRVLSLALSASVVLKPSDIVTISYTPGTIVSEENMYLPFFTNKPVTLNLPGMNTIIADAENNEVTKLLTAWYTFNDNALTKEGTQGESTIIPATSETVPFVMTSGGADATANAVKVEYDLNSGNLGYNGYVGFGFDLNKDKSAYDLSGSTGISFYHKGSGLTVQVGLTSITDNDNFTTDIVTHTDWTLVTLPWGLFKQASTWGKDVDWDQSLITKFQWQIQNEDGSTGEVWIDEVRVDGKVLDLPAPNVVSKTALRNTLNSANELFNTSTAGSLEGQYPQSALTSLLLEINDATIVYDDETATQATVDDAASKLEMAISSFLSKQNGPAVDKNVLAATISASEILYSASTEGTQAGQFPAGSKAILLAAINEARTVHTNSAATQTEVDTEQAKLADAIEAFSAKAITPTEYNTLIANCEDGNKTKLNTYWYSYNDNKPDGTMVGKSTISPLSNETTPFVMTAGGANGTDSAVKVTYTLNAGTLTYNPYVGIGFAMKKSEAAYDLSGSTGISFYHKGDAVTLQVVLATNTASNYYTASIDAHASWEKVTVSWTSLDDPTWGTFPGWDASQITKFQWQKQTTSGTSGTIWIDEVTIDGKVLDLPSEPEPADKTTLAATILAAETLYSASTEGTQAGQYPAGSKAILLAAINEAKTVNSNAAATQNEVNTAVSTLNTVINAFNASINTETVDKTALSSAITNATTLYNSAQEGSLSGQYPAGTKAVLLLAINEATSVNSDPDATKTGVTTALTNLGLAVSTFESKKNGATIKTDSLLNIISNANTILSNATIGTGLNMWSKADSTSFAIEIAKAIELLSSQTITQASINQAITDMNAAIEEFESKKNTGVLVDSVLKHTVAVADSLKKVVVGLSGDSKGQYPTDMITLLTNAIGAANELLGTPIKTQSQIDKEVANLDSAMFKLERSALNNNIRYAEELLAKKYDAATAKKIDAMKKELTAELAKAKSVRDSSSVSTSIVVATKDSLLATIDAFDALVTDAGEISAATPCVLFPVPAVDVVTVKTNFDIETISISDMSGHTITRYKSGSTKLDVSSLAKGVYIITISSQHGNCTETLLK